MDTFVFIAVEESRHESSTITGVFFSLAEAYSKAEAEASGRDCGEYRQHIEVWRDGAQIVEYLVYDKRTQWMDQDAVLLSLAQDFGLHDLTGRAGDPRQNALDDAVKAIERCICDLNPATLEGPRFDCAQHGHESAVAFAEAHTAAVRSAR